MAKASNNEFPSVLFTDGTADPSTPSANTARLFVKDDSGAGLYLIDDAGAVTGPFVDASGAGASPLTTKGDVYTYGTADARLAVGSDGQYLTADSGEATGLAWAALPCELVVACSDESTAIDATGTKATFRMPYAMTVTAVRASLTGACTTGTFTVDINEGGTTILSTKLTIDATEKTSTTAAAAAVISDSALADDAEITIDVDDVGDSTATGLKVALIGTRA